MPTYDEDYARAVAEGASVCRHLRTKAMWVYGQDTPDAYRTSRSGHYHCLRTQFVTGPDGGLCVPEACRTSRGCFESR
jgi:hypothetical protein